MSKHVSYHREESISSERTLDNLENLPSNLPSPVISPNSKPDWKRQDMDDRAMDDMYRPGSTKPPHHGYRGNTVDDDRARTSDRGYKTRVSWQERPESAHRQGSTSQFTFDYEDVSPTRSQVRESRSQDPDNVEMTRVGTGSDSSPIRRLKRKDEGRPTVERELSDAYIESMSRTPRYTLGRHNTYDDMLDSLNSDDPFKGQYQPSGKTPRDKSGNVKSKKHGSEDKRDRDRSKKKSKKRKKLREDFEYENQGQRKIESYTNEAYNGYPTRRRRETEASTGSTGTYTLKDHIRASVTNLTAAITRKAPSKLVAMSSDCHKSKSREEVDQEALARFISRNKIVQLECSDYVRDMKSKTNNCMCGRSQEWHMMNQINIHKHDINAKNLWHLHTHTKGHPADSFGVISFQGFGQETLSSPYIRLSPETELETVWSLMTDHWKLPIPKLLISVTGGAQRFDLNPRLQAVFKRGLINAATSTGAWIITGGTATGVMRFVGDAVRDHLITTGSTTDNIIALGIATWGCIANREALDGDGDQGLFPATYSLEDVQEIKGRDVPLDHNHTHFILVDNGTDGKFGAEIEFRSEFEHFVSDKVVTGVAEAQRVNVPVVMLVVEGGVNTMLTVYKSIRKNIPVLVLNGSGRAADFIAYGYNLTRDPKNEDKSKFPADFDDEMMAIGKMIFAWKASDNVEKKIMECIKQLKDTLEHRKLVNIFNLGEADTKDIDRAILYALLKANKTNANAQLSLALAWNRCDIARHEIFTNENRQYWRNLPLYDAMFTALVQDRVDFVQLFLENGVSLKKFLSIDTLWNLYGIVLQENADAMAQMLNNLILYLKQTWTAYFLCHNVESAGTDPDLLYIIGKLMVHLLGDENFNLYRDDRFRVSRKNTVLRWLAGNHESKLNKGLSTLQSDKKASLARGSLTADSARRFFKRKRQEYDFGKQAERELFLWAILFNRRELAKMLWKAGQDQLGAALTACAVLKTLSSVADDDEELELSQDLLDHANMYEDMAVGVLSECYKKDKMMAHQCLVRRLELYGRTTLFTLADTHTLMKFMGHTSCQTKLNLIWKGRMALYTPSWKILLCLLFPFMVPTIKFTTNEGLLGSDDEDDNDDYDDLDEGEEVIEQPKEDVHIISNKVTPNDSSAGGDIFVRSKTRRRKNKKKKLYRIQMCGDVRTNNIGILNAFYCFYTAPVSVFVVNTISYLIFLGLFTYFVLTDLYSDHLSAVECVVWGWTITMLIEEIRQVLSNDKRSLYYKINGWFGSMWNRFDLAMYIIFTVSVILRFTLNDANFTYCRICYSITVAMYYLRFMQVFFAEKNIGPKVIMITNMVIDLVFFLGIFLFFLLSFGIMYQANLFPNSPPSWYLLRSVLYIPYWQMYGELFLENLEGENPESCTSDESIWRPAGGRDRCPENNALVPLLGAVYLILTNILLVNLLIAMFSYTFQMVQDRSEQVWRFYRYSLVYEFYDRPKFCPPFIILSHIYRCILYVQRHTCSKQKYTNEFKLNLDEKDNNRLTLFVRSAAENYLSTSQKAQKEELSTKVADTANRIERVIEELDSIKEQVKFTRSPIVDESRPGTAEPGLFMNTIDNMTHTPLTPRRSNVTTTIDTLEERMNDLGEQVSQTNLHMSQMMNLLQNVLAQQQRPRQGQLDITEVKSDDA